MILTIEQAKHFCIKNSEGFYICRHISAQNYQKIHGFWPPTSHRPRAHLDRLTTIRFYKFLEKFYPTVIGTLWEIENDTHSASNIKQ